MRLLLVAILLSVVAGAVLAQGGGIVYDERRLEESRQRRQRQEIVRDAPELADRSQTALSELDMIKRLLELIRVQDDRITQLEQRVSELETAARKAEARR